MSTGPEILLTQLQLHQLAAVLLAWLEQAATQELSYTDCLAGLLEEELVELGLPPRRPPDRPEAFRGREGTAAGLSG